MDVLLTDADIITMAAGAGPASSMLIRDGHIVAAGPDEQAIRLALSELPQEPPV